MNAAEDPRIWPRRDCLAGAPSPERGQIISTASQTGSRSARGSFAKSAHQNFSRGERPLGVGQIQIITRQARRNFAATYLIQRRDFKSRNLCRAASPFRYEAAHLAGRSRRPRVVFSRSTGGAGPHHRQRRRARRRVNPPLVSSVRVPGGSGRQRAFRLQLERSNTIAARTILS